MWQCKGKESFYGEWQDSHHIGTNYRKVIISRKSREEKEHHTFSRFRFMMQGGACNTVKY